MGKVNVRQLLIDQLFAKMQFSRWFYNGSFLSHLKYEFIRKKLGWDLLRRHWLLKSHLSRLFRQSSYCCSLLIEMLIRVRRFHRAAYAFYRRSCWAHHCLSEVMFRFENTQVFDTSRSKTVTFRCTLPIKLTCSEWRGQFIAPLPSRFQSWKLNHFGVAGYCGVIQKYELCSGSPMWLSFSKNIVRSTIAFWRPSF